jgi:hypothetical protein
LNFFLLQTFFKDTAAYPPDKAKVPAMVIVSAALQGLLMFALWANLHSGFALGLAIVLLNLIFCALPALVLPVLRKGSLVCLIKLAAFSAGALAGSLITPFQFRLYAYLPELFFHRPTSLIKSFCLYSRTSCCRQTICPF